MATTWPEEKQLNEENPPDFNNTNSGIVVTHDLQDCIDESLDLCFNNIYEQLPVINYSRYSEETERPENSTYIGKLEEQDENAG